MPIDPVLSLFSDRFYMGAVAVYVLAMLLHAAEYVAARDSAKADVKAAALVGAGGETGSEPPVAAVDEPTEPAAPAGRPRSERFGRMAVSLTVLGVLLHLTAIVLRGLAAQRWPLGNMYEFTAAICLAAMVTWLVVLRRSPSLRRAGVFVLTPVLILMFLGGTVLYAQAAPVVPALQSYWLVIHVTTVTLASGLFLVAGVASLLYLLSRTGKAAGLVEKLPSTASLDRLAYRVTAVAFPIYTFAVIAGAIWAEAAWGRFWGWDPKETVAFVAWVVYAAYLHARATAGWRTTRAAWINALGFAVVVFNLFFINMVVAGLHSYAGLPS
ncbi:c-type cytochrome biogenesis protein CcsB [Pseudonocardia acidicola]|uniref:C-type cytochrome biogenesis protein CcsB n=1 Tax=Pseudonocardia acidicola TaxID=2724939 RepID=A0ABX1SH44_9PSEU|nr:c-type cytochrome biogenesis protein CcsB [Pseudonocardia acidicola]NMH99706.1 c-type cytochrome biogenesis protein CcsB [Pseudonocardia acidicola]